MSDKEFILELEAVARKIEETDDPIIAVFEDHRDGPLNRENMLDAPMFVDKFTPEQRALLLERP